MFGKIFVKGVSLLGYLDQYAASRGISRCAMHQMKTSVILLERFAGKKLTVRDLTEDLLTRWLREYAAGRSPTTTRNKRVHVLALWRQAADDGLCRPPTRRIYRPQQRQAPVVAWTPGEVQQLLAAAAKLPRQHPCGLSRADWWSLAIRVSWDSALRWGDQCRLRVADIDAAGRVAVTQSKTGRVVVCQMSPMTIKHLRQSVAAAPRTLVTPWLASRESFNAQMRRLVVKAGVRPGTWKWLRRGSATDVERLNPGRGSAHLGHAPGSAVAARHYFDQSILAGGGCFLPTALR